MMKASDLVFVGFNRQIAAVDKYGGDVVWKWTAPRGSGYVALVLDGERLYASVEGYTYCIEAVSGRTRWENILEGMGTGVPCLAVAGGISMSAHIAKADEDERRDEHSAKRNYGRS